MSNDTNNNGLLTLTQQESALAETLDKLSATGLACRDMQNNFTKVILSARCVAELKLALTPDVMKDIMSLQGSPLGFRTDKDDKGGYNEATVKEAIIAAAMLGLMPVGNQFNIIGGRFYITKEGFMFLLGNIAGLRYDVDLGVPKQSNGGAVVHAHIVWTLRGGEEQSMDAEIPVRVNNGMGADAVLGKAMRKACCRLYNKVTNSTLSDGDVTDDVPMRDVTPRWSGDAAAAARRGEPMKPSVPTPKAQAVIVEETQAAMPAAPISSDAEGGVSAAEGGESMTPEAEEAWEAVLEQRAAALDWMRRSMSDSGKSWNDVYKVADEIHWMHPEPGSSRDEMERFSLCVFRSKKMRDALVAHGFILAK